MSTKIYNGFSVATDSAVDLMNLVDSFRPYVRAEGQKMLNRFLRKTATPAEPFRGWKTWREWRAETINKSGRAPKVNIDFQLVFFSDQSRFLGIAFTEHARWFRQWLRQPLVSEYQYWNNADQPCEISRSQWQRRAETWDRVLGLDTSATRGFIINLHEIGPSLI